MDYIAVNWWCEKVRSEEGPSTISRAGTWEYAPSSGIEAGLAPQHYSDHQAPEQSSSSTQVEESAVISCMFSFVGFLYPEMHFPSPAGHYSTQNQ
jgi:hypothetical protein